MPPVVPGATLRTSGFAAQWMFRSHTHRSVAPGWTESAGHRALPAGRDHQGLLDRESAGPAPTARVTTHPARRLSDRRAARRSSVAEVFRRYGDAFRAELGAALSTAQRRVMTAIEQCRTAALGGHVEQCDHCGHRRVWYNSCRNRHCPICQSLARAEWLERRRADLLPTEYFHVVFTVPPAVAEIAAQNKAVVYGLLFRTVAETLRTIAADPRHLGAQIGFFAVLLTWGQTLGHLPHLHCVIPGGGLANDGSGWIACRPGFFLPVRVLSRYFRRVLLAAVEDAFESGLLRFVGRLQPLADPPRFAEHLRPARQTEWVVYAKRPFAGPPQRRLPPQDHHVVGDRVHPPHAAPRAPARLPRIRYYGFLANRARQRKLAECRQALAAPPPPAPQPNAPVGDYRDRYEALTGRSLRECPRCHAGNVQPLDHPAATWPSPATLDSS